VMMRAMMWATGTMAATTPATTPAKGMVGTPAGRGGGAPGGGRGGGGGGSGEGSGEGSGCILQGSLLFIVKIFLCGIFMMCGGNGQSLKWHHFFGSGCFLILHFQNQKRQERMPSVAYKLKAVAYNKPEFLTPYNNQMRSERHMVTNEWRAGDQERMPSHFICKRGQNCYCLCSNCSTNPETRTR
jgi:hypothetical protein